MPSQRWISGARGAIYSPTEQAWLVALLSFLRHICALSAVVCSQVVRAMSFDSDIVVGFHLRLLFETRLVVCGSLPEAAVKWSAVASRVGSHRERLGPFRLAWLAGRCRVSCG